MFQKLLNSLKENKNWLILVAIILLLIGSITWIIIISQQAFNLKKETKEYKELIKSYDKQLELLANQKDSLDESVHYYKWLSDSLQGIQENTHYQTTKIIYKINEEVNNVDKLSANSNIELFSILSDEAWRYYNPKDSL